MTRTHSFRALTLATMLALGAPLTAYAAPSNTGGAAEASEFQIAQPMQTTRGSVLVAEQKGGGAQANGNALATQVPVAQYMVGDNVLANVGNGAEANSNALATQAPVSAMAAGNSDTRVGNGAQG